MTSSAESELAPENDRLREGVAIGGKYRLLSELGSGGMGVVWRATHLTLGHHVAIKFLLGAVSSDEDRLRFDREAKLAARLGEASRHIARVIDHGVTEDRAPYLVMELLRGESLATMLKREKRLPLPVAARIIQQLSRALHVAHSAGVIHRDLKPANIFICTPEEGDDLDVKLLDFGVAKATFEHEDDLTTVKGRLLGTPRYMSPEQVTCDRSIDTRADLWAVAAIVYRMVVGRSPFRGESVQEIALRIVASEPVPPSTIWKDLPVELDRWVERGLAKTREHRFQNVRELSDFLSAIAGVVNQPASIADVASVQRAILEDSADETRITLRAKRAGGVSPKLRVLFAFAAVASIALAAMTTPGPTPRRAVARARPLLFSTRPARVVEYAAPPPLPSASVAAEASASAPPKRAPVAPKPSASAPDDGWANKSEL